MGSCIVCTFTEGLDELPRRKQRDTLVVLEHLAKAGRFSVFEATANIDIARTMDRIGRKGLVEFDISGGYPWTKVKLTPAGSAALGREHG